MHLAGSCAQLMLSFLAFYFIFIFRATTKSPACDVELMPSWGVASVASDASAFAAVEGMGQDRIEDNSGSSQFCLQQSSGLFVMLLLLVQEVRSGAIQAQE